MKILLCGGSGFIGQNLAAWLLAQGHELVIVDRQRSEPSPDRRKIIVADLRDPQAIAPEWFAGVEGVINLSGRNIFTLWDAKAKREIWESRVEVNKNLLRALAQLKDKPKVFITASAIGFYGNRGEEEITEASPPGKGFLADLCQAWEGAARPAEELGVRVVAVRTAPVLGQGGIIRSLKRLLSYHLAFVFGTGQQWFSWIHMTDLVRVYELGLKDETLRGPVNGAAPNPVRYGDFIRAITRLQSAVTLPLPEWAVRLAMGQAAEFALSSLKVIPRRLRGTDFPFTYPELTQALKAALCARRPAINFGKNQAGGDRQTANEV